MAFVPKKNKLGLKLWVAGALLYLVPQAFAELALGWHYRAYVHWAAFFALVAAPLFPLFLSVAKRWAERRGKDPWGCACWLAPVFAFGLTLVLALVLLFVIPAEKVLRDGETIRVTEEARFLEETTYSYAEKRGLFFMEDIPRPTDEELYALRH